MTWHPTNGQALLGFISLIVGGILLIRYILRPEKTHRPADATVWNGRFFLTETTNNAATFTERGYFPPVRNVPHAPRVPTRPISARSASNKPSNLRKRDERGRFAK